MASVEDFLSAPRLPGAAADAFQRGRVRVAARHGHWRRNFPAVGLLLDSDEERAHALAGNYATEARETVGVWLASQDGAGPAEGGSSAELVAWLDGFWDAWRRDVLESEAFTRLDEPSRERFRLVFDDLTERFHADSVAHLIRPPAPPSEPRWWSVLAAPLRAVARFSRRIFLPDETLD